MSETSTKNISYYLRTHMREYGMVLALIAIMAFFQYLTDGVLQGKADAVLAASIFHFGEYTIEAAKKAMQSEGVEVRL